MGGLDKQSVLLEGDLHCEVEVDNASGIALGGVGFLEDFDL